MGITAHSRHGRSWESVGMDTNEFADLAKAPRHLVKALQYHLTPLEGVQPGQPHAPSGPVSRVTSHTTAWYRFVFLSTWAWA